ncbi:hypothetical protein JOF48_000281 [Arthrobacter stackebrandtii]|uniref:Uncharacterized protein n=1 Tax=Arthrobacter stackebrandtii TaxID=272161 RepID=A0ABS4YRR7_9MICC|nr:hypothetical protein [Arthrobacter stackebrandtii]MBP2411482.1 hypothetical protein [Arthrobacter stackebrandtii]PYH00245.1 hypothetical protein CVV67_10810 [Arthrobacter stackebrandtii]
MSQSDSSPSAEEARALLVQAEGIGNSATSASGWPTAMIFMSLAIIGSMMMTGFQIVAHTGYGAPLLAVTVGIWAAITAFTWTFMHRTTKIGFSRRFAWSLITYFAVYILGIVIGVVQFPNGNMAYYITAAVVLGATGIAAAFRELRA